MAPERIGELDFQMQELKRLLKKSNKFLGIDFDDTLVRTNKMFREYIGRYLEQTLWHLPDISESRLREEFERVNNEVFHRYGVNPNRWEQVVELLAEKFSSPDEKEILHELKYHFANIYIDIPELKPGAIEFLNALVRHKIPFIIITHANEDWTWHKIDNTELRDYLSPINVEIVNEDGHKDRKAFIGVCQNRDLEPEQVILIEDSLRSIRAAYDAGIVDSVLITNPEGWTMYTEGEIPEQTQIVDGLLEIPGALVDRFKSVR